MRRDLSARVSASAGAPSATSVGAVASRVANAAAPMAFAIGASLTKASFISTTGAAAWAKGTASNVETIAMQIRVLRTIDDSSF